MMSHNQNRSLDESVNLVGIKGGPGAHHPMGLDESVNLDTSRSKVGNPANPAIILRRVSSAGHSYAIAKFRARSFAVLQQDTR